MTRLEAMRCVVWRAMADPQIHPPRVIYKAPSSKVQLYASPQTPIQVAVSQWKRRFAI